MIIAIDGPMGSGKTTLARALSRRDNLQTFEELLDEVPAIEQFYRDPDRYALDAELQFLKMHARRLDMAAAADGEKSAVVDFTLQADRAFAAVTLGERQFRRWEEDWRSAYSRCHEPDVVLLLRCSVDEQLRRITARRRTYERFLSPEYLLALRESHARVQQEFPPRRLFYLDASLGVDDLVDVVVERLNVLTPNGESR